MPTCSLNIKDFQIKKKKKIPREICARLDAPIKEGEILQFLQSFNKKTKLQALRYSRHVHR
ncbi:Hypothetical protein FKW44_001494 [Caligus rogercresseyi]|uniref:Uncharacterized protein n=1 Tax=Caligus rogercresseyi TaxID=217165 RepID=A0A7T8QVN7_CALRO|nr:Hypothetical protein FKW44_001494 [Caligus rogercresseyi]